jgi:cysteinyl-tRNA synthetase
MKLRLPFLSRPQAKPLPPILFTNTLGGKKDRFAPIRPGVVSMYSCGPTVYSPVHIGNLRSQVLADLVARTLSSAGYRVKRVMNITDVGHLVGDADQGEDKMAVGAKAAGASPEEIAKRYAGQFLADIKALNFDTDAMEFPYATDYIQEQVAMVKALEEKGLTYAAADGIYFDTTAFAGYGKLGGVTDEGRAEARIHAVAGKKHPHDFALWRKAKVGDLQQWDSPWGRGNPGWHIECSAMIRALLGPEIDVHTGGIDLIPVHHNNEIAQSESANGRPLARYWVHGAFLSVDGDKIAKSLGNGITLADVREKGFHPLALRYFFLQASYRTPLSFSWTALSSAAEALNRLWRHAAEIRAEAEGKEAPSPEADRIMATLYDDLSTPQAIGLIWEAIRDEGLSAAEKWGILAGADRVLGLSLARPPKGALPLSMTDLPGDIRKLVGERDAARKAGDFPEADRLRNALHARGYRVDDGPSGTLLTHLPR